MRITRLVAPGFAALLCLTMNIDRAEAQESISRSSTKAQVERRADTIDLSTLLARHQGGQPAGFRFIGGRTLTSSELAAASTNAFAPPAPLTVQGSGTTGRVTKWSGSNSVNSSIADSTIFEDKFGKVGIGTDTPTSKLTVAGTVETRDGVKFADGTIQTTAFLPGQLPEALVEPFTDEIPFIIATNETQKFSDANPVPAGKRLIVEHVSVICDLPVGQRLSFAGTGSGNPGASYSAALIMVPVHIGDISVVGTAKSRIIATQSIRMYIDAGKVFKVAVLRSASTGSGDCGFVIAGFLVNVP